LVRKPLDAAEISRLFGREEDSGRQVLVCDLTDPGQVASAIASLPMADRALGVHAAADVSWNKPLQEVSPLNVQGSLNFCQIVRQTSRSAGLIYVSTAYTSTTHTVFRNSYEESKALGEIRVQAEYPDLQPATFSCSLILGHSRTGEISRFHGLYPMLRYAASFQVPFWVCDKQTRLDLIPLDWTVEQLLTMVERRRAGVGCADVVASAGESSIDAAHLVEHMYAALNDYRRENGFDPVAVPSVISYRRWLFLRRSIKAWGTGPVSLPKLRFFERLMEVYRCYVSGCSVEGALPPANVVRRAPHPREYLKTVLDYWFRTVRPPIPKRLEVV
jgi:nucleoside-diphosphate-sugar epimerase